MKTVGEVLQSARLKTGLTIEDIAATTRISAQYIEAIEQNQFSTLPPSAFTKGFIKNYASVVGVDPQLVLAIFRRDYDQDEKGRVIPRGLEQPIARQPLYFSIKRISWILTILLLLLIASFFGRQIYLFSSAPPLNITSPLPAQVLTSPLTIAGNTLPQASLAINQQPVAVSADGSFSYTLDLSSGNHTIILESTSRSGQSTTRQLPVTIEE